MSDRSHFPQTGTAASKALQQSLNAAFGALVQCQEKAVPALTTLLETENARSVRYSAVIALGSLKSVAKDAVPALLRLLEDADKQIHRYVAQSLAQIGAEAVADLEKALTNSAIRYDVLYALGLIELSTPKIFDILRSQVDNINNDLTNRWIAAAALSLQGVNMADFFEEHDMLEPDAAGLQCSQTHANLAQAEQQLANGEPVTLEIYDFDIYTRQCVRVDTVVLPPNARVPDLKELFAKGRENARKILRKPKQ